MIAQLFLTALLSAILLYAWIEYDRAPIVGLLSALGVVTGLYFIWVPSHATAIAHTVGIGRGVDLIMYVWVGLSFILLLNLHLKVRAQMELMTQLARALTLLRAGADDPASKGEQTTRPPLQDT